MQVEVKVALFKGVIVQRCGVIKKKKTSLLHDNELMRSLLNKKYLLTENFTVALEALLLGQLFIFRTIFQH